MKRLVRWLFLNVKNGVSRMGEKRSVGEKIGDARVVNWK